MLGLSRLILLAVAALSAFGGLLGIASGEAGGVIAGLSGLAIAAVLVLALALERMRYDADRVGPRPTPVGPGGTPGDEPLEARFRPTEERFVDPTSGRTMRVWLDPRTGERRYRPEA